MSDAPAFVNVTIVGNDVIDRLIAAENKLQDLGYVKCTTCNEWVEPVQITDRYRPETRCWFVCPACDTTVKEGER